MRLPAPVAVLLGGSAGGAARLAIDELAGDPGTVPWDVIVINAVGSFALGLIAARIAERGPRWWTPLVTTGALGGFTTFSAIAALRWTADAPLELAVGVLLGTMAACVLAAAAGWRLGAASVGRRSIPPTAVVEEDER